MEKVTLIPTDENSEYYQEHVAGRHGKDSATIGSKLLENIPDDYMLKLLKETDKADQTAIDGKGTPGRMVFAVEADKPIGTNAVFPIENLEKGTVFSTTREPGTDRAAKVLVALVAEEDMPKTNIAQVIMGHYGPTGKAGIYTMICGDEGMPFPEGVAKRNPNDSEFIGKCQKYWDSHVMLIQELALKTFLQHRNGQSPIVKPFTPEISPNAVKLKLSNSNGVTPKTYENGSR